LTDLANEGNFWTNFESIQQPAGGGGFRLQVIAPRGSMLRLLFHEHGDAHPQKSHERPDIRRP
jgi:hypothetical protein